MSQLPVLAPSSTLADIRKLTVPILRKYLYQSGLVSTGTKEVLVKRLKASLTTVATPPTMSSKLVILLMCAIPETPERALVVGTLEKPLKQALGIEQELGVDLQQTITRDMPTSHPVLKAAQTAAQRHNHTTIDVNERHLLAPAHSHYHLCKDRDVARNTHIEDSALQALPSLTQM